jgi:hypothetical protein
MQAADKLSTPQSATKSESKQLQFQICDIPHFLMDR